MTIIKTDTVTAPAIWASALINGDESGLDLNDIEALNKFCKWLEPAYVVDITRDDEGEAPEPRFTWHYRLHHGTADGGEVIDYTTHEEVN